MKQDIRSGSVDMITPGELGDKLHEHLGTAFSRHLREIYRGLKIVKLPVISITATATSLTLYQGPPGAQCGPESGYLWEVKRVTVESSGGSGDNATVALYTGSDPSAQQRTLVDRTLALGRAFMPGSDSVWLWPDEVLYALIGTATVGNTYTLSGIAIEVPVEMQGKLLTGG